jgi:hypothetical protein
LDTERFDSLTSSFAGTSTRRGALRFLAAAALGAGSLALISQDDTDARRKRKKGKSKRHQIVASTPALPASPTPTRTGKALRQICIPGQDTCATGLQCGTPTTRHTCSSTVGDVDAWCCVPPGGRCTECDCCGDYYCSYDDNNVPMCVPNPEN